MKKVLVCVGTRPNLIKITRLKECFAKYSHLQFKLLHTGQHYDYKMSEVFFEELGIPKPDVLFDLKRDSQMSVVTQIMTLFEEEIKNDRPDLVVVPGDVDSTFACAFVSSRFGIPVAHIESGLRSFDKTMPEEINRILVDDIAQLFFTTEKSGNENLLKEGKKQGSIVFTGNTMIDSLIKFKPNIEKSDVLSKYALVKGKFLVMTFHRPANVDNRENLTRILNALNAISEDNSLLKMSPFINPYLLLAIALSVGLHSMIVYVPVFAKIFGIAPMNLYEWGLVFAFSVPVIFIDEVLKIFARAYN